MLKLLLILSSMYTPQGCAGGTLESGRTVVAYSDGLSVSCAFDKETATVRGSGYVVVVAPTEIKVDKVRIPIDQSVVQVTVHFRGGVASFVADGHTLAYYDRD
jgi:hypothetical protein